METMIDLIWGGSLARFVSGVGREEEFVDAVTDVLWRGIARERTASAWGRAD